MPIPSLSAIGGNDLTELIDSLEKQRKELEFTLANLDNTNVSELNAEVINAGVINAKHISIGSETTYQTGYSPNDIRIEMETQFEVIDGQILARVLQTDFNALGQRVASAESTLSVLPGQISSKVSQTDYNGNTIASLINQTATTIKLKASNIDLDGIVNVSGSLHIGNPNFQYATKYIYFDQSQGDAISYYNGILDLDFPNVTIRSSQLNLRGEVNFSAASSISWGTHSVPLRFG